MALGREVDDEARCGQLVHLIHEHASGLHFVALACSFIGLEVLGPRVFELERDAPTHDADAVDRVDDSVGIVLQNVAAGEFDEFQWSVHVDILSVFPRCVLQIIMRIGGIFPVDDGSATYVFGIFNPKKEFEVEAADFLALRQRIIGAHDGIIGVADI